MKNKAKQQYFIGVDGGGAKTTSALADQTGRIIKVALAGPANLRNLGISLAAENIAQALVKILRGNKNKKIASTYIGLASIEEEFKLRKKELQKELKKYKEISPIFQGKITIGSDQTVAFYSGTNKKEGLVLIAGAGSAVHGWKGGQEAKASGWGWLNDEGSGFWIGQKALQAVFRGLDNREKEGLLAKLLFRRWQLKNKEELLKKIYAPGAIKTVSSIAKIVNEAALAGDKKSKLILEEAGKELAEAANYLIKKLNFQKSGFPLVMAGSVFESKIVLAVAKKEIKKLAPKAEFIRPGQKPIVGAVKLAIKALEPKE